MSTSVKYLAISGKIFRNGLSHTSLLYDSKIREFKPLQLYIKGATQNLYQNVENCMLPFN